jgi:hypothetical protein
MERLTLDKVREFVGLEVDEFFLDKFREKHGIAADSSVFYTSITRLVGEKKIKRIGRGYYKKIKVVKPVKVFGRERRPPITIRFPRAQDTGEEFCFAQDIVFREGDAITLGGVSNYGKTTLCINFCGENIHSHPVLMGNEYTDLGGEPMPRFLSRLDDMNWVEWADEFGEDNFTLLPVREDYAEHIVKDKMNILDWVNLDGDKSYDVSKIIDACKREVRRGVLIAALQKNEGKNAPRGGSYAKDFSDCELLLDPFGKGEILLTIGKLKEPRKGVPHPSGRTFAYKIIDGVRIVEFREVVPCPYCKGMGTTYQRGIGSVPCSECFGRGKIDKGIF